MPVATLATLESLRSELVNSKYYLNVRSGFMAPVTLHCSYGDSGESVSFYIFDGSEKFNLAGSSVSIHGTRRDGANFGPFSCTTSDTNRVTFTLTSTMTAVEGGGIAEFVISKSGSTVGTANFGILVEKAVFPNGVAYDSDPSVYQDILRYVQTSEASINSRISNIVAQAGDDNTEIVDARLDAENTVTYPTLKDRLDAEYDNTVDYMEDSIGGKPFTWVIGSLNTSNGQEIVSTMAIRSSFYKASDELSAYNPSNRNIMVFEYDNAKGFIQRRNGSTLTDMYWDLDSRTEYIRVVMSEATTVTSAKDIYDGFVMLTDVNAYYPRLLNTIAESNDANTAKTARELKRVETANRSKWAINHTNLRTMQSYDINNAAPISICTDGYNFLYDFDIEDYKNQEDHVYYVSPNGRSNWDGLSEGTPKLLSDFLDTSNAVCANNTTIILLDGVYRDIANGINSSKSTIPRNYNLIAKNPGKAILAHIGAVLTWTKDSTYTNCYRTSRSNVLKCVQLIDDEFIMLTNASSLSECDSTQGTWYLDSNTTLYAHLFFDKTPDYYTFFPLLQYYAPVIEVKNTSQNTSLYMEGIVCLGGRHSTAYISNSSSYTTVNFYAKDCQFIGAYSPDASYDGISILGGNAYFVNCKAMYSSKDGFNYHAANGKTCKFIEIDCVGAYNGTDGNATIANNNGSTAHDGCTGVRINGAYYCNNGPNVSDVHTNTRTYTLNCVAFDSLSATDTQFYKSDYNCGQAGATMYVHNCVGYGSKCSAYCAADATLDITNCDFETEPAGNGTIIVH